MRLTSGRLRQIIKEELDLTIRSWHISESPIDGRGIFATRDIAAGTIVGIVARPSRRDKYRITSFGALVNHQSEPNCRLKLESDSNYWLCTLTDISEGQELVSDYRQAPSHHINSFLGFIER